ncbi:MAG: hypothetical protein EBZ40_11835, partial [Gammaproteobacteria bacterium]|nr:hypothetical protein [Gammaproteobacteria bacterium]
MCVPIRDDGDLGDGHAVRVEERALEPPVGLGAALEDRLPIVLDRVARVPHVARRLVAERAV